MSAHSNAIDELQAHLSTHHMAVDSRMNQMLAAIVRTQTCESCWMHWMRWMRWMRQCQMASVTCLGKCWEFKSKSNDKIGNHGHMSWRFGLRHHRLVSWGHAFFAISHASIREKGLRSVEGWANRVHITEYNSYMYIYIYICINKKI